ncbi:hypothetical protein G7Z17_g4370 [Cylindrodendrum hubeiense]|uniref:Ankyrin n=1 Tax=Cylindrodendrum hubeiense TaxID=595255 RepID=A0A9P5HCZ0_9HYPO|nr:hypothetical protein G7Z17_g4370 [Cylindrodendrum hubeiense]
MLSAALAAGGDPDEKDQNGNTALQCALHHPDLGMEAEVKEKMDEDMDGETDEKRKREIKEEMKMEIEEDFSRACSAARLLIENGANLFGGEVISAILLGDWELVKLFLSHGGTLKETDENGMSAFEAAILSRNPQILDIVIEELLDCYDAGALCAAIVTEMDSIIDRILTKRPPQAQSNFLEATAIGLAAKRGDLSILRKVLEFLPDSNTALVPLTTGSSKSYEQGAVTQIHTKWYWRTSRCFKGSPLAIAIMGGIDGGCEELLRRGYRADRLTWNIVSEANDLDMAQILVRYNQRFENNTAEHGIRSPLAHPILRRNKELVHLFLEAGANVNEHNQDIWYGRSPLQWAVEVGDLDIMDCLLKAGADVNAPPAFIGGGTALQLAAIQGHIGVAKHLLDLGANINALPSRQHGRTALEGAAERGRLDMLQLLIHHGDQTRRFESDQYARSIDLATSEGHHTVAELLQRCRGRFEEEGGLRGQGESLSDEERDLARDTISVVDEEQSLAEEGQSLTEAEGLVEALSWEWDMLIDFSAEGGLNAEDDNRKVGDAIAGNCQTHQVNPEIGQDDLVLDDFSLSLGELSCKGGSDGYLNDLTEGIRQHMEVDTEIAQGDPVLDDFSLWLGDDGGYLDDVTEESRQTNGMDLDVTQGDLLVDDLSIWLGEYSSMVGDMPVEDNQTNEVGAEFCTG